MLNQEELLDYIRKAKLGDEKAKEMIFLHNEPLIKSIIRRFKNKGVEYDDLYQIASIGFLKAINNFDESFCVKFSTYSVPMVIGEIKRYMRDNGAIKVSRTLKILANKINKFIDAYQTENNQSPSIETIAEKFEVSAEEVVVALDSVKMPLSIFDKFEDDDEGQELIDKIPYEDNEDSTLNKIQLSTIIETLSDREKKIIFLRYFRDKTQIEIAETMGVSQVQISRLENKIIDKIRLKF
ncbi:MAG: SigB/SigF/SigG family RNA polymerase sigma factor [Clostridia bacterium]|nr:SigB/SigF/SigG family RNA polymerase sigma factor [Clostridia bacterium]